MSELELLAEEILALIEEKREKKGANQHGVCG